MRARRGAKNRGVIYLDHNATTRPSEGVVAAVAAALREQWANPSSVHRAGQEARRVVELARQEMAELLGTRAKLITWTGSGTEALELAIRGAVVPGSGGGGGGGAGGGGGRPLVMTTAVEHAAVRDLVEMMEKRGEVVVERLPIDGRGVVKAEDAARMIAGAGPALRAVVVQWANNETGVIQPVEAIGRACRGRVGSGGGCVMICDGTQWVGKRKVELGEDGGGWCDVMTCSPHKFGGPKGVGVMWIRGGVRVAVVRPGSQEKGRRGGTENVPGIAGAGVAAAESRAWLKDEKRAGAVGALRDEFERRVVEGARRAGVDARVNGAGGDRLENTTNVAFPRLEAEALLLAMSERGVAASAGAACSSGSLDPSPVLLAMGVEAAAAHGSVRFSLGRETTAGEVEEAARIVIECVERVGKSMV